MKCPKCDSNKLRVIEKRDLPLDAAIRRRRQCESCDFRFTTYERIEVPTLMVVKKDGTKEPYDRSKIAAGFYKALEKRPFDPPKIEQMVDEIGRKIQTKGAEEIASTEIGDLVIEKLKEVDEVAYLRFVSVYKSFSDVDQFRKELNQVICGADECEIPKNNREQA